MRVRCRWALDFSALQILRKPEYNVFGSLICQRYWRELRATIVKAILGTDMTHHFGMIKETKVGGRAGWHVERQAQAVAVAEYS